MNIQRITDHASRSPNTVLQLWQRVPFFAGLTPEIVQALANVAARYRYAAGTTLFSEGEPASGLYLIEAGSVKICRFSKEGREHTLHVFNQGDTFNDVAAFDGWPNPATAIAFTDAIVWRIEREALQELAHRYPALAWALLESIARRTRFLVKRVQELSAHNVKARLARLLLEHVQASEEHGACQLLTQEEMASRLGTVREVVGRALRSLVISEIIAFERHRLVILDPERLAEEAEL
jgi:CRP/FNR family transcriptional regulator, cyclic AMP receptor protein